MLARLSGKQRLEAGRCVPRLRPRERRGTRQPACVLLTPRVERTGTYTTGSTTSAFTAAGGDAFTTEGAERDADSLRVSLGLAFSPPPTTWCGRSCGRASEPNLVQRHVKISG